MQSIVSFLSGTISAAPTSNSNQINREQVPQGVHAPAPKLTCAPGEEKADWARIIDGMAKSKKLPGTP